MSIDPAGPSSTPSPATSKTNTLGVVAFILAVLGFLIGLLPFVALVFILPALVLGLMALFKKDVAKGLAVAAVILASIALLTNVVMDGVVLFAGSTADDVVAGVGDARPTPSVTSVETPTAVETFAAVVTPAVVTPPVVTPPVVTPAETVAQKNAVKSAQSYLAFTSFSRSGLIEQLEFEGFSTADAEYAVDHVTVDWNEQAAKAAQSYLDFTSFSRSGLIDQLVFDGYTTEQATYGVNQVGL